MPNSIHVQLADAVVTELNYSARPWFGQFTAARSWRPWYDGSILESLQVAVVPLKIDTKRLGRGASKMEYDFEIAIDMQRQENVSATNLTTRLDALDKMA